MRPLSIRPSVGLLRYLEIRRSYQLLKHASIWPLPRITTALAVVVV